VEILVPGEHISSSRNRVSIVGYAEVPVLRLYVNGEFQTELTVQDSVFHASVSLPYGLNEIEIVPMTSDIAHTLPIGDSVEILCGPRFSREQGRFFGNYRFHGEEKPSACLNCHAQDIEMESGRRKAEWCYPCHNTIRQRLREHTVDDVRPCTGCHPIDRDLTAMGADIRGQHNPCYQCHQDKIGLFVQDYVHGPVAGGTCTVCHDPHGSEFAMTLVSPVPVLCATCHTDISGKNDLVQHYPFAQGWCIDCHDPHATSNKWVLIKEGAELCFNCHYGDGTEITHRHPYGVKPKKKLASPLPLGKDGKLECLSCHKAHASNATKMLRTNTANICLGCHPDGK
jgi:predicted CXXCH cytochrome family protein